MYCNTLFSLKMIDLYLYSLKVVARIYLFINIEFFFLKKKDY